MTCPDALEAAFASFLKHAIVIDALEAEFASFLKHAIVIKITHSIYFKSISKCAMMALGMGGEIR
jgi:hypothetical protein